MFLKIHLLHTFICPIQCVPIHVLLEVALRYRTGHGLQGFFEMLPVNGRHVGLTQAPEITHVLRGELPQRTHRGLCAQRAHIRSREARRPLRDEVDTDLVESMLIAPQQVLYDFYPAVLVGQGYVDALHEASPRGLVQLLRSVRRSYNNHSGIATATHSIQLNEKFCLNASTRFVLFTGSLR